MDGENDKLKIVEFKKKEEKEPAIHSGLVSLLEELLQDAKNGQLNQLAVAFVGKGVDKCLGIRHIQCHTTYIQSSALLGQVCLLKDYVSMKVEEAGTPLDE